MLKLRTALHKKINKRGFTLAELLVVVAIIAILVAVSIPIFSGKLEEARKNTDLANVRAAKAVAVVEYLSTQVLDYRYYDATNGVIVPINEGSKLEGYNQLKQVSGLNPSAHKEIQPKQGIIRTHVSEESGKLSVTVEWLDKSEVKK